MSKTDTVTPFSLIFARKVHLSENSSIRKKFCQNWPRPLLVITTLQQARGVLGREDALTSTKFAHGVHMHGV